MQVNSIKQSNQNVAFNSVLNNKLLVKGIGMAADNGVLFSSATSLALSTIIRPLAILSTPNADKENKQYACSKSIASSIINFGITALVSIPMISAIKNIENNPKMFLTEISIKSLQKGAKSLAKSPKFNFLTQFFRLGSGFVTVVPKTFLTCALIPPVMSLLFNQKNERQKDISFNGVVPKQNLYKRFTQKLSKIFSPVFNDKKMQQFADKFCDTSLAQHMFSANDVISTGLFMHFTAKSKNIKNDRKKTLIYNAGISTAITIIGGYLLNAVLHKPTEKFINAFKKANPNLKNIEKYKAGIKNAKAAILLGGLYYIVAPFVSTMMAEYMTNKK